MAAKQFKNKRKPEVYSEEEAAWLKAVLKTRTLLRALNIVRACCTLPVDLLYFKV